MEQPTPQELKRIEKAYMKYADSHTIWDNKKTGSFLDSLPRVIPMEFGKTQFTKKCLEDKSFFNKWYYHRDDIPDDDSLYGDADHIDGIDEYDSSGDDITFDDSNEY